MLVRLSKAGIRGSIGALKDIGLLESLDELARFFGGGACRASCGLVELSGALFGDLKIASHSWIEAW